LRPPLLVIHGTADPVFPIGHGVALCAALAGARLLKLEGGGHELHAGHWDRIVEAIAEHMNSESTSDR
jgi:pimeloyl-ACP methyl ester carboxylesterase